MTIADEWTAIERAHMDQPAAGRRMLRRFFYLGQGAMFLRMCDDDGGPTTEEVAKVRAELTEFALALLRERPRH